MNSLNQVISRINEIEYRFKPKMLANPTEFSTALQQETKKIEKTTASSATPGTENADVAQILHVAANKYGVDPKLVFAIAKAESDFNQDTVSSAGAVGVMQLMPETAASLGVRNIKDPRENIDGGVCYLKQMLTMFNGDVTKAVAAYNAGPQAVKDYNGVPPYAETKAYVANVLSMCK